MGGWCRRLWHQNGHVSQDNHFVNLSLALLVGTKFCRVCMLQTKRQSWSVKTKSTWQSWSSGCLCHPRFFSHCLMSSKIQKCLQEDTLWRQQICTQLMRSLTGKWLSDRLDLQLKTSTFDPHVSFLLLGHKHWTFIWLHLLFSPREINHSTAPLSGRLYRVAMRKIQPGPFYMVRVLGQTDCLSQIWCLSLISYINWYTVLCKSSSPWCDARKHLHTLQKVSKW